MGDSTKMVVKLVVVGGAAYFLYYWLNKNGLWQQWFGSAPAPAAAAPATTTTTTTTTGQPATVTPPATPALATTTPYVQAIAAIKAAASNAPTETFDGWSFYWQNAPTFQGAPLGFGQSGSISPHLFGAVVAAGGGDNNAQITAETFVNLLAAQQAQGISGLAWFGQTRQQQAERRGAARFLPDYAGWVN